MVEQWREKIISKSGFIDGRKYNEVIFLYISVVRNEEVQKNNYCVEGFLREELFLEEKGYLSIRKESEEMWE